MPCDGVTQPTRDRVVNDVMERIKDGSLEVRSIGGRLQIQGSFNPGGMCDVCILRELKLRGDYEVRAKLKNSDGTNLLDTI